MRSTLHIVGLALLCVACGDMGKEPSTLSAPQILGARANPRSVSYGSVIQLEAITYGVEKLEWFACFAPYLPDGDPKCATAPEVEELALGSGDTVELTIPDESVFEAFGVNIPGVYVRMLATGADGQQISVATIPFDQTGEHPEITGFTTPDGDSPTLDVETEGEFTLKPELTLPADVEDVLVTWFVEGGEADPFRTKNDNTVTIRTPEDAGPMRVIAVVRDGNFGIGWNELSFTVAAP